MNKSILHGVTKLWNVKIPGAKEADLFIAADNLEDMVKIVYNNFPDLTEEIESIRLIYYKIYI